jgi:hypothetical protein
MYGHCPGRDQDLIACPGMKRKRIFSELEKGQFFYYPGNKNDVYEVVWIHIKEPLQLACLWLVGSKKFTDIRKPEDFKKQIILTTKPPTI